MRTNKLFVYHPVKISLKLNKKKNEFILNIKFYKQKSISNEYIIN